MTDAGAVEHAMITGGIGAAVALVAGVSLFLVYWTLDGYYRALRVLGRWSGAQEMLPEGSAPPLSVAVLLTVRDEAAVIRARVENLLACLPPGTEALVYVVSDGSTDGTDDLVSSIPDRRVKLLRPATGAGKSAAQNWALAGVGQDVVVFTDADTVFMPDTLTRLLAPFACSRVGCTTGVLTLSPGKGGVGAGHARYWRREMVIRREESRWGALAVATGACMAVRRRLLPPLDPCVGEDCTIPLAVVSAGYRVVHVPEATAVEAFEASVEGEWRTRVRMTERNWRGTWQFPRLLNVFSHPRVAFSLWSHKILRWLTPFFLMTAAAGVTWLGWSAGFGWEVALGWGAFAAAFALGALGEMAGSPVPGCGLVFAFVLANAGFAMGVSRAMVVRRGSGQYR